MRAVLVLVVGGCARSPAPRAAAPAPPRPGPFHDPDHARGPLPTPDARKTELRVLRDDLDAMDAHRLEKERRYGIDEDGLFAVAETRLLAAATWAAYDEALYATLTELHDGHLTYVPPATAAPSRGYDRYTLGIKTVIAGGKLLVASVDLDSDAAQNIHAGDEIVHVDRRDTAAVLDDAVKGRAWSRPESAQATWARNWTIVLVPRGTRPRTRIVTVRSRTGNFAADLELTPRLASTPDPSVTSAVDAGVAIVTVHSMNSGGGRAKAIDDALAAARDARGIVLDLRGNHGGVDRVGDRVIAALAEGDAPLGTFRVLAAPATIALRPQWKDLTVGADGWTASKAVTVKARPAGQGFHGPIAVVIDAGCVSTCEVVAAALRADLHATLVGETTGGSSGAPVQVTLPASRGSVAIPTWDLTSAEGKAIEGDGVVPDEPVSATLDTLAAGVDAPLARAVERVRAKLAP